MRTLEASQAALLESPGLRMVTLVKLTTYTDRLLGTVQAVHYFSESARLYKWAAGAVQQFEPWLLSCTFGRDTMNHLPSADGSAIDTTLNRTAVLMLRNWLQESASYLYPTLRAENLEFARVEVATVFLGPTQSFSDLSNLAGTEMTWLYRGQVSHISQVQRDSLTVELEMELPRIPLTVGAPPRPDPRDAGRRMPMIFGVAKHVQLYAWSMPPGNPLGADISSGAAAVDLVGDLTLWPDSGVFRIDAEECAYTANTGTQLTGLTRGYNSTSAATHSSGALVIQIPSAAPVAQWIVSTSEISSLDALYVKSGITGELIRLTGFTAVLADRTLIPGYTVATVTMSQPQWRTAITAQSATICHRVELFADVTGPPLPYDYAAGYSFDEGTSWNVSGCTQANDTTEKVEGASAQKLSVTGAFTYSTLFTCDATSGFFSIDANVALETTIKHEGTGSVKCTTNRNTKNSRTYHLVTSGPLDWTGNKVRLWVYLASASGIALTATDGVRIRLGSGNMSNDFAEWAFGTNDGVAYNTWSVIEADLSTAPMLTGGAWTLTGVTHVGISYNIPTRVVGAIVYLDLIELGIPPGANAIMQRNATTGTVDLTTVSNRYRVSIRHNSAFARALEISFSNTAGSGTTRPASYWRLNLTTLGIPANTWTVVEVIAVGVGAPATPNNVETFHIEASGGVGDIWFDKLEVASGISSEYAPEVSTYLENMPNILRYVLTRLCVPPVTLLDANWNDAAAALEADQDQHACDLAALGETSSDVLARLAFEARCNLLSVERAAGTTYKLLAATPSVDSYTWGTPVATLTRWSAFIDDGRDGRSILTRVPAVFGYEADRKEYRYQGTVFEAGSEAQFGVRLAPTVTLLTINLSTCAAETMLYYAHELGRIASTRHLSGSPWTESFVLEKGDVVQLQAAWDAAPLVVRVIEKIARPDYFSDLVLVDVSP